MTVAGPPVRCREYDYREALIRGPDVGAGRMLTGAGRRNLSSHRHSELSKPERERRAYHAHFGCPSAPLPKEFFPSRFAYRGRWRSMGLATNSIAPSSSARRVAGGAFARFRADDDDRPADLSS